MTTECKERDGYKVGRFAFSENGRAAPGRAEGFVKIIRDAKYGESLGAHITVPSHRVIHGRRGPREKSHRRGSRTGDHAQPTWKKRGRGGARLAGKMIHV